MYARIYLVCYQGRNGNFMLSKLWVYRYVVNVIYVYDSFGLSVQVLFIRIFRVEFPILSTMVVNVRVYSIIRRYGYYTWIFSYFSRCGI